MKNKNNIILIACILIIIILLIIGFKMHKDQKETEHIINEYTVSNNTSDENTFISILRQENSDTVGYIVVKGTNIDYPVVQSNDNSYYLSHSFDKSEKFAGWVFLDYRNNLDTIDKNNIIYGHAMNNGTMFGSLKNVLTDEWLNNSANHIIELNKPNGLTKWQVFSVYYIPVTNDYLKVFFSSDEDFLSFENMLINRSIKDFGLPANKDDKILTLSTCKQHVQRIVVHAKLISE